MKRYPLLIQLVPLLFSLHSPTFLVLLVASTIKRVQGRSRQQTERTTRNSIDHERDSEFITSYPKKLKQTTTVLYRQEQAVRQFAQESECGSKKRFNT